MFKISLPQKTWQCEKRSVSVAYGDFLEINLCVWKVIINFGNVKCYRIVILVKDSCSNFAHHKRI